MGPSTIQQLRSLEADGLSVFSNPDSLKDRPFSEVQEAFCKLQEQNMELIQELTRTRSKFQDESEFGEHAYMAFRIQDARVSRLLQLIQDMHGKEFRDRIYSEISPEILRQVSNQHVQGDEIEPQVIYHELKRLAS